MAIVRAIAYSDLPDWKDLMLKFAERMPARKALIDRFVYGKQPTIKDVALDAGTSPLDIMWGLYFATGSFEPISRIVSILTWAKDQNNVERLTIGSMAKLSLATNASRDKELLDMLKGSMNSEGKETRVVLQEVIDAAETFEFGKVRKDAVAAIDQLKMKGPASARNFSWWGTARTDRAGARLHRRRRHGPSAGGHPLRSGRRGLRRRTQVLVTIADAGVGRPHVPHDPNGAPAGVQRSTLSGRQAQGWWCG